MNTPMRYPTPDERNSFAINDDWAAAAVEAANDESAAGDDDHSQLVAGIKAYLWIMTYGDKPRAAANAEASEPTKEQCDKLRSIRRMANAIVRDATLLRLALSTVACPHFVEGQEQLDPDGCRYCELRDLLGRATDSLDQVPELIDSTLSRGPATGGISRHGG